MKIVHYTEAEKIFVIDFSNLVMVCNFGYKHAKNKATGAFNGHVYGFMEKLHATLRPYLGKKVSLVFAIDHKAKRKMELYPEYKKGRTKLEFNPIPDVRKMLNYFKCTVIEHEDEEADDVIASFCKDNCTRGVTVEVITTDKDMWQIAWRQNIRIFNTVKKRAVLRSDLEDAFGLRDHTKIPLWKAIFGDGSDNIKAAIPRIRKKDVVPLINACDGTVDGLYKLFKEHSGIFTEKTYQKIEDGYETAKTNMKIVALCEDIEYKEDNRKGNKNFLTKYMHNFGCDHFGEEIEILSGER